MKNKNYKPAGKCVFCGDGNLTKEHLWPKWISKVLPRIHSFHHESHDVSVMGMHPIPTAQATRQGEITSRKFRVVCQSCNNGWMSLIEDSCKPVLTRLLRCEAFELTPDMQRVLCSWLTMKSIVLDAGHRDKACVSSRDSSRFYKDKAPIPSWHIFVGGYGGSEWQNRFRRAYTHRGIDPSVQKYQSATFVVGGLFMYTICGTDDFHRSFNFPDRLVGLLVPINPVKGAIAWPRTARVNDQIAMHVSESFYNWFHAMHIIGNTRFFLMKCSTSGLPRS